MPILGRGNAPAEPAGPPPQKRKPRQAPAPSPEDLRPSQPARTAPPRQPRQQQLAPSPEDVRQPKPTFTEPNAPKPHRGPPVPVLQNLGFHGSIWDFGQRLAHVVDAHQTRFGYSPPPGFALDLARSPVHDVGALFDATPGTNRLARLQPLTGGPDLVTSFRMALHDGTYNTFAEDNQDALLEAAKDKKTANALAGALFRAQTGIFDPQAEIALAERQQRREQTARTEGTKLHEQALDLYKQGKRKEAIALNERARVTMGLSPEADIGPVAHVIQTGAAQIFKSLAYSPGGIYHLGGALAGDIEATNPRQAGGADLSFQRTRKIGTRVAEGVVKDVRHPYDNPGYLFMDILGAASGGAGAGLRVARAGTALRAGEGVGAAVRTLASRPVGGTYALRQGDLEEHVLLFENPIAQSVQRMTLALKQRGLDRRFAGETGAQNRLTSNRLYDVSGEKKIARAAESRKRVERAVAKSFLDDLRHAAGWSVNSSDVFRHLPVVVRKGAQDLPGHAPWGLTRGEQKAIQVLSTDDPNPLQLHRDFHQRMIDVPELGDAFGVTPEQFVANHQRHLADLKLAETALRDLDNGRARRRFRRAVEATNRTLDEQQRIKIEELGLSPVTAETRIASPAEVMRTGELRDAESPGLVPQTEDARYQQFVPKRHKKAVPAGVSRNAKAGPYGIPLPRDLPELKHVFTGKSIIAGDFRIDATNLAGESYGRAVRLATVRADHARLWRAAKDDPNSIYDVPIRNVDGVPPELRERLAQVDEGEFTRGDAGSLDANEVDLMLEHLYPNPAAGLGPDVKWVDGRLIGDEGVRTHQGRVVSQSAQPGPIAQGLSYVNEPFRLTYLFLRPAYALNALGNAGMGLIHQGVLLPLNLARAVHATGLYGRDVVHAIDNLIGEGRAASFGMRDRAGRLTSVSGLVAHGWSVLTDRMFRRAALIHELRRQGFRTPEQIRSAIFDEKNITKLNEANQRANKAMVQFDNLTWYEKNVLRHAIFVYPWVSRSAVWSIRTLVEHPVQSAVLAHLGEMEQQDTDQIFDKAPDWVKRTGYFPVGYTPDGRPKLMNPTSINSFSTINDMIALAEGGEVPEDFSSPLVEIGVHAITQRDQYGQRYKGKGFGGLPNQLVGPLGNPVGSIPIVRALQGPKKQPPLKAADAKSRNTLIQRERSALKQSVLEPTLWGNWGSFVAGGLAPKALNLTASEARYWGSQPLEKRNKHERALVQQGLSLQGELLKQRVPADVRQAATIASERSLQHSLFAQEQGRAPTARERAELDIGVLAKAAKIPSPQADKLRRQLKRLQSRDNVVAFIRKLNKLAGGNAIRDWQADVNYVTSFSKATLGDALDAPDALKFLKPEGRAALRGASQDDLLEIGRQALAYRKLVEAKLTKDPTKRGQAVADRRAELDAKDKPIEVNGTKYPSPARLEWILRAPEDRAAALAHNATTPWHNLSSFEKQTLGVQATPGMTKGWALFQKEYNRARASLPPGESIPQAAKYKTDLAKYIDRYYAPGFFKDYRFAREPLYQRLQMMRPIQDSPNQKTWRQIFVVANQYGKLLKDKDHYSATVVRDAWKRYVDQSIQPWAESDPAFRRELKQYRPTLLRSLLDN